MDERIRLAMEVGYDFLSLIIKVLKERFDFSQDNIDELMCEMELLIDERFEDGV